MSNSRRPDYVSCVVCGESIEYRIYNKHWAHTPGHRTKDRPRPPKAQAMLASNQLDDEHCVDGTDEDQGIYIESQIVDEIIDEPDNTAPVAKDSTNDERIHSAGS